MLRPVFQLLSAVYVPGQCLDHGALKGNFHAGRRQAAASVPPLVDPGVQIVVPDTTELDLLTCPAWRRELFVVLERADCKVLVVDLSRVEFFGATGLGVLVETRDRAAQRGIELRLVICSRPVRRPLEVMGLAGAFAVYDDRANALAGDQRQMW